MNISIGAFAIAGGIILIVLSIGDVVTGQKIVLEKEALIAIVPLERRFSPSCHDNCLASALDPVRHMGCINIVRPESARCLGYLLRSEWNTARHG